MTTNKRRRFPVLAIVALLMGLGGGYAIWGTGSSSDMSTGAVHDQHENESEPETWTCSMHPQIQLPEPGQCPICGMDLIPVAPSSGMSGLRRLSIRPDQKALMRLRTVPVERRFPEAELRLVGKVTYDETRLGYITAWVPGRIDDLYVDYTGVTVSEGDHMVKLYSPDLYTAQQELIQAISSLEELQRSDLQSLRESAQGTIDSAREKLRLWGLTLDQISTIEERGTPEEHVTIYSPSAGLVIHRNAQEGMYVQTGTRIFTIADLSHVWVQLDAYESDLEWLRYGQEVIFRTEAYGGREFRGRISFIDPVLDRRTRTVKVRVNVPNEDRLLKPDMFVRATVHARIAAGGKVMDPSLVGKWISPMHPEVVKDEPGQCDVCGMDLVPAEELGYIPDSQAAPNAPLVVPVSATLMTGTRAIVYVELPDTEVPTYEGREVVLGPRAGDEYIILHGLEEGDLVVAEGNFKIDSALQLQAKPSMMSPTGGQASGGHDHGGHGSDDKKMEMQAEAMRGSMLSEPARARLQLIERLYATAHAAHQAGNVEDVRRAFSVLSTTVNDTEMALFSGESHQMWMELSMRLSNDAFEGHSASDAAAQSTTLKKLDDTVAMMRKHFGTTPEDPQPKQPSLSETTMAMIHDAWSAYNTLHRNLAADDLEKARAASDTFAQAVQALESGGLPQRAKTSWSVLQETVIKETRAISAATGLAGVRSSFEKLSVALEEALRALGSKATLHVMHCPMAFDGRGARWLQDSEELLNPYFGESMLNCGSTLEVLKPRENNGDN